MEAGPKSPRLLILWALFGCTSVTVPIGSDSETDEGLERYGLVRGDAQRFVVGFEPAEVAIGWPVGSDTFGDYQSHIVVSSARPLGPGRHTFVLEVSGPPPAEAFTLALDAPSDVVLGAVVALGPRDTSTNVIDPGVPRSVARDLGIVYFTRDGDPRVPNDDVMDVAEWLGVAPTRGYHLHRVRIPAGG
jgi:hypothetical protein